VDGVAIPRLQSRGPDRREEATDRPVEEAGRGLSRLQLEVDRDRVTLVGPDAEAGLAEGEAALVVRGDDPLQVGSVEGATRLGEAPEERLDLDPSARVQIQPHHVGAVPQDVAEVLADAHVADHQVEA
jgi:hypothetical protein